MGIQPVRKDLATLHPLTHSSFSDEYVTISHPFANYKCQKLPLSESLIGESP
jgi:hypothetical protein